MGCWNGTCAVSNLHITAGQEVAVFMLLENKEKKSFCYSNALYDICVVPFYGKYNDYMAVEDCHGFGLNLVVEAIRDRLYKFGQGSNSVHDCAVNKENFNVELMFDADHEDRLGIEEFYRWNHDEYELGALQKLRDSGDEKFTDEHQFEMDRLAAKIKKEDGFRRVTHVMIHGKIFRDILDKWYIEEYIGDGKGTTGYGNNYNNFYFKDLIASIDDYIEKKKKDKEAEKDAAGLSPKLLRALRRDEWDSPIPAVKWLNSFNGSEVRQYGLIDAPEYINEYIDKEDWDGLRLFVTEVLTGMWIHSFMSWTRKVWTKQSGEGSQNGEHRPYEVLIQSMQDILKAEQEEYGEDEDWDESDPENDMNDPEMLGADDGVVSQEPIVE